MDGRKVRRILGISDGVPMQTSDQGSTNRQESKMHIPDPTVVSRRARKEQAQEIARLARALRRIVRRELRLLARDLRPVWTRATKAVARYRGGLGRRVPGPSR